MATVANPQDIDQAFTEAVRKSSKEADVMEHKDEVEKPSIASAIKEKAETVMHKVAETAHKLVGHEPPKEGEVHKPEPPIGARNQDAAEFYAERASQKFDSENSSLPASQKRKSAI